MALQGGGSGRYLEQLIFDLANLPSVDLSGAYLEGASLVGTQFRGALLNGALGFKAQSFFWTGLQGASVFGVQLMGAFLNRGSFRALLLPCSTFRVHHSQMRSFKALFLGIRRFGAFRWRAPNFRGLASCLA